MTRQLPIHQTFDLPKSYRAVFRLDGSVWEKGDQRPRVVQLRTMASPTAGHTILYAQSIDYGPWVEIDKTDFVASIGRVALSISINP